MKNLLNSALLIAIICLSQTSAEALHWNKFSGQNSHVGYDLHTDIFYLDDKLVDKAFKRSEFNNNAKITLAGQGQDMTGRAVSPSLNPFAVAQKSVVSFGSNLDRWDVKENEFGHQFFGLYQGNKSPFVVNALRASLLKNLIEDLTPLMNELDARRLEERSDSEPNLITEIELRTIISVKKQDKLILNHQKDSDSSSAKALVVIVTKHYLVTINVGGNKAVAVDALGVENVSRSNSDPTAMFGGKKNKNGGYLSVMVDVIPRARKDPNDEEDDTDYEIQFLIMETASVVNYINDDEVSNIVLKEVKSLGKDATREQDMYSRCVNAITSTVTSKMSVFNKVSYSDHTVIMIGLTRDYRNIH